jgi:hypothetical protein
MAIYSDSIVNHIHVVHAFEDLVSTEFSGEVNAVCWSRNLKGDFAEIANQVDFKENMIELSEDQLRALHLSADGSCAREILLNDLNRLKEMGAAPVLNVIQCYDRDDHFQPLATDVYSFHVDRSDLPTDTYLCTYFGEATEILPNSQAIQKILIPEIRSELMKIYSGRDEDFERFLKDYSFDLHFQPLPLARPMSLGLGNLWKLAVDHPGSRVLPCLHRAPREKNDGKRLLLIC